MMSPVLQSIVTRFAPSPTGELHLGSAYSAWTGWHRAREAGGTFLVRIEDIDIRRCRREYETSILADLKWLGFDWDGRVRRQSEHFADYGNALDRLDRRGLVYPCFCSRAAIERELAASATAPHGPLQGPDGPLYPGTCRHLSPADRRRHIAAGHEHCLRLDCERAAHEVGPYHFFDESLGRIEGQPLLMGDFVIARKDTPSSYHLSVTVDDHLQGVTLVTRGMDVLPSTHVHRLLQELLGYAAPQYAHHRLLTDATGRRFAKRDRDMTVRAMRESGMRPEEVVQEALRRAHDHGLTDREQPALSLSKGPARS
jgi:glutamyl-Q tRNA(Asp) synthetase